MRGDDHTEADLAVRLGCATRTQCRLLGANTRWNRFRFRFSFGTGAAS